MKKTILFFLVLIILAFFIGRLAGSGKSSSYPIDYGESEIFTRQQLERSVQLIQQEFRTWHGCEMHSISYAGDQWSTLDNLLWLNELAEARGLAVEITECAMFLTDYHSPMEESEADAWNLDYEYTDWQWWLGCTGDGKMILLDWGY